MKTHVEIPITVVVTHFQPAEPATPWYPGCPAYIEWTVEHENPAVSRAIFDLIDENQLQCITDTLLEQHDEHMAELKWRKQA